MRSPTWVEKFSQIAIKGEKLIPTSSENLRSKDTEIGSINPSTQATEVDNWSDLDLQLAADQIVLDRYAPVGVIIDQEMEILQFRGQTGAYLEPASGKASFNLLKMARVDLLLLRSAIYQAKRQDESVRKEGLLLKSNNQVRTVNVEVIPFKAPTGRKRYFLVLFEEATPSAITKLEEVQASLHTKGKQTQLEQENAQLKQELATTKEYLQSIIEDQSATNESLQVASEEILSSNEELQSTNEELETAQEEIQATNEELNTVNEELRHRNLELNQINNDLQNLLNSINIPILMLSGDQRIRRFTSGAERNFNLIPTDVGRPFRDIQPKISIPNLGQLIKEVIDTPTVKEQEVQDQEGYWYHLRIRPYKTMENQIDGAVIGLIDINSLKRSAVLLEEARDYAAAIVDTVRQPLVVLDADLRVITANRCFYKMFQVSPDRTEGQLIFKVRNGQWNIPRLRSLLEDILPSNTQFQDFEVTQVFDPIGSRTMLLNARKVLEDEDRQMILLAMEDITERQQAQEQILTSLREKEVLLREIHHRVKNNLQIISSLLSLQSNRIADPQASEGFEDSQNRVRAMSLVHEILYQSDNFAKINFAEYAQNLVTNLFSSYTTHSNAIALKVDVQPDIVINTDKVVLCGLIMNELVTNALKHGFPEGRSGEILVTLSASPGDLLTLTVGNNGESLPADFNLQNLQSMGLNLVMTLIQQLKGTLELERSDKTIFKITFAASI